MEEEEYNKKQSSEEVGGFEKFIETIPVGVSLVCSAMGITRSHLIAGKDMSVRYACGTKAATPVQYVTWVFHCSTISPLSI